MYLLTSFSPKKTAKKTHPTTSSHIQSNLQAALPRFAGPAVPAAAHPVLHREEADRLVGLAGRHAPGAVAAAEELHALERSWVVVVGKNQNGGIQKDSKS